MAGHSKWSKVKHNKGPLDQKRGQLFSKLAKEITVASSMGGGIPSGNPRLHSAILTARVRSMPNENIAHTVRRWTGEGVEAGNYEVIIYEAYAPGGVALIMEAATDNKNRTAAELLPLHALEDNDDVQNVHSNFDAPEELLAKVA